MKVEDGKVIVKSVSYDDQILASNKAHRLNQSRLSGKHDFPFHPKGAKISYHFQAPADLWIREKRQFPELFAALHSRHHMDRELAAQVIAQAHPEWVITSPKVTRIY